MVSFVALAAIAKLEKNGKLNMRFSEGELLIEEK